MGTAERRLDIMKFLCRERYATMPSLAKKYGVSLRTIQRDIFELSFMMPLEIKTGKYIGGVYVMDDYTMDRMYMSAEELALLHRIRELVFTQLSDDERFLFDKLIDIYTMPVSKKIKT